MVSQCFPYVEMSPNKNRMNEVDTILSCRMYDYYAIQNYPSAFLHAIPQKENGKHAHEPVHLRHCRLDKRTVRVQQDAKDTTII